MEQNKKYVDNDVFKYSVRLKNDYLYETVYTKPFPEPPIGTATDEERHELHDRQENLVLEKYFTKEKIEVLKLKFIKEIIESENPFDIYCIDRDGGYFVTEDMLFNVE